MMFNVTGRNNNQTSVSDADREFAVFGSMTSAGNTVHLVSGIFGLPSGWDFLVCSVDR